MLIGTLLTALGWAFGGRIAAIVLAVAVILAILGIHFLEGKSKAEIFLYAVAALLFLPGVVFSITGRSIGSLLYPSRQLTSENIEPYLKELSSWK